MGLTFHIERFTGINKRLQKLTHRTVDIRFVIIGQGGEAGQLSKEIEFDKS